ncbi:MAG: hypothetical protein IPH88_04990 [Bacteroidales bacterium]|nr:hypothetical protein [Bacteroidales bacterium]
MSRTNHTLSSASNLRRLVRTVAELYRDDIQDTLAVSHEAHSYTFFDARQPGQSQGLQEACYPHRNNPFDGSMVAYDEVLSRFTIMLSLAKSLRVVAELYSREGVFIKCMFDRHIQLGLTEISGFAKGVSLKGFIVMFSSSEGMKSFKINERM